MIRSSEFFPLKRPPRTFIRDFNLIITNLYSCIFCATLFVLIHNHKTNALSLVKNNTRYNENDYTLGINNNKTFLNNISKTDDSKLYQPWKYVYSNKSFNNINDSAKNNTSYLHNIHLFLLGKRNISKDISLSENVVKFFTSKSIFGSNASTNSSVNVEDKTKTRGNKAYFLRGANAVNCSIENEKLCDELRKIQEKRNTVITENSKNEILGSINGQESKQSLTSSKVLFPILQRNFSCTDKNCRNVTGSRTLTKTINDESQTIRNTNEFTTGVNEISSEKSLNKIENLSKTFRIDKYVNMERYSGDKKSMDKSGLQTATEKSHLAFTKFEVVEILKTEETYVTKLAKTSKERDKKLSSAKVKRISMSPRDITNLKDDEDNFSDDDNYGIRRSGIKSDKSVSTLLSPLDITPLLKKNKNKELDKKREKENKAFNRQAHESEGPNYTTKANVRLPITRDPSTQLVTETSVTTMQVPRSTGASNIVLGVSVNQSKTSEHLHGTREDKYGTGPRVEVLTRTNGIKSTDNLKAVSGRDLVTNIPQGNQLEAYPLESLSPNQPLKAKNVYFKHTKNLTDCDKNQSSSGCNDSIITSHNIESNKTLSSLNSLFKLDNQSESNSTDNYIVLIKSANTSKVVDTVLITVATSASVIFKNQSVSENDSTSEDIYNSVTSDPYQYSTEPNNLDTQTNFEINRTSEVPTEGFLFTYEPSDNTSTPTKINPLPIIYTTLIQTESEAPIIESVPHVNVIVNETLGSFRNISEVEESVKLNEHTSSAPFTLVSDYTLTTLPSVTYGPLQSTEGSKGLIKSDGQWLNQVFDINSQINATSVNSSMASINSTEDANNIWPVKLASVVEGDIILGGLMMVHSREDTVTCGPIMPQGGIQALEAMLYTLDRLNSDPGFMPNVTLGAHILDDCDKDTYGLEMAVDFIKDLSNQPSRVECFRHDHVKIYDYTSFYQDDIAKYNDDSIIEEDDPIGRKVPKRIFSTTSSPLEVFESYFVDREKLLGKDGDETPSPVETNKKTRKHHKHRHRKKKPKEHSNQSFESFFNNLAVNKPTGNIEEYNEFLYEDDLKDYSETEKLESKDYAEENSLKDFEDFLKDVKTKDSIRQEENDVIRQHINKTKHAYHDHIKLHNHKHGKHAEHHVPHEFKMMDFVDPTVQELIMLTPGLPFVDIPWPVKKEAVVEGDVLLGGLMMVHSREDGVTCGPIMPQGGIQALEAMLYTLDIFNSRLKLVPNVTIGAHILDDCDKDTYGLEMAVDFIKGSISNIDGAEYHCNKTQVKKVISGVVGAASSVTSIQVANLLRLFKIPQVSFFSTSPELSNKQRFEYFTRTIPSDHYQVKAMVDIVQELGWSYVSIIYEESNYGIKAFEELEGLLSKHNICIAVKEKLVKDSGVAEEIAYDSIVIKLLTKPRARGVIIFGSDQEVAGVMRAVRRSNATGAFSWIGSDGWSARNLVSDGNEPEVEGTLSVQPQANPVKGFQEYFLGLTVDNNERNPWFVEFWEDHFHCRYLNSSRTPYNLKHTTPCTGKEKLTKQNTDFEDQLQFVSDAVMAFAYAIRDMHKELCKGKAGLCEAMKPTKGPELLRYLRKVQFEGLSGDHFKFDQNGDGPARYNIIHFKQVAPGKHRWIKVGEYLEGELKLNMTEIQFKLSQPKPPESVCSLPCEQGQGKQYVEGESCCWHCFNCTQYQIRHPTDETQCLLCPRGTVPDEARMRCRDIPEVFLRPGSAWAIGAMAFSSTGILVTLFVAGVFLRHNDTPVVRASGRELSYVLLAGILMCYCVTFALVIRPSDLVCGIQRFGAGFCFTVVYAALLTKTNRISRIFNAGKQSAKRPSLISPRSQLIICSGFIGVQVVINGVWMIISPARAMHHYPTREDNLLVCDSYVDASYMIAFSYPIVLIVVCTVYAVLTRKIPEAFNESKHIGFTMYTTCVIWLAFVPLYFGTGNHVPLRITSMSVTISLSASVTVACLFSPKLYIILIRPERNVRQSMMPVRYSAINKSSGTANSGVGSMMAAVVVTAATCNQKEKLGNKMQPSPDPDLELEKKKVKVEDRGSQTDTISNYVGNQVIGNNLPMLTSLPLINSNDLQTIARHQRRNSFLSPELPSPQLLISRTTNGNMCAAVTKVAQAVAVSPPLTSPVLTPGERNTVERNNIPGEKTNQGDRNTIGTKRILGERNVSEPMKTVSFVDDEEYKAAPVCDTILSNKSNTVVNNNSDDKSQMETENLVSKTSVFPNSPQVLGNSMNNVLANPPNPACTIINGPALPTNITDSTIRDIAL